MSENVMENENSISAWKAPQLLISGNDEESMINNISTDMKKKLTFSSHQQIQHHSKGKEGSACQIVKQS